MKEMTDPLRRKIHDMARIKLDQLRLYYPQSREHNTSSC